MPITPMEIKGFRIRHAFLGYDRKDVEALREIAADALTEAIREHNKVQDEFKNAISQLFEHKQRERILKDTITTAQKMVEDLKTNARKESELIMAEAHQRADEILAQAQRRALEIHDEILGLKKQRIEFETKLKGILEYHMGILSIENKEAERLDEEAEKLRIFQKPAKP